MSVDKSWIQSRRSSQEYFAGVEEFIKYATRHISYSDGKICCPCIRCKNRPIERQFPVEVHSHLLYHGIDQNYTFWYKHGEKEDNDCSESGDSDNDSDDNEAASFDQCDDMQRLVKEGYQQDPNEDAEKFYKLLEEAEEPLYPGCENYSNLSFVVNLMHIKSIGNMNNKGFDMLLKMLKNAFPMCDRLPTSNYGAKKIVKELGLHYERIDACKNDCIIYYKEYADATACPRCKVSRWKKKNIPWKVLRYFPLTPRLQRLFMSSKTALDMKWHSKDRVKDGVLRHPADAEAWKIFDQNHVSFANENRNVRLGLATDGFNPFGNMSVSHSTWPVFLFPYNLPPWMCMKEPYIFMSLLIPGPKGPGKAIDVYLRPLIDELQTLWEYGVETYDISTRENFQIRAAVMWTINDFPAYGYMSGWSTQGKLACPCCASETSNRRLRHGKKTCYMRHRRFLPLNHPWRKNRKAFDNTHEKKVAPRRPSGEEVINELHGLEKITHGKKEKKKRILGFGKTHNWNKHSIFFSCLIGKHFCCAIIWM